MARALLAIVAGLLAVSAGPACAVGAVYTCSFAEVLVSSQGKISTREVSETIRVDDGMLQTWSPDSVRWLSNQCGGAACVVTPDGFRFETVAVTQTDSYSSTVTARLTISAKTGQFDATTLFATTLTGTADLTEASTHNAGTCHGSPDPAAP